MTLLDALERAKKLHSQKRPSSSEVGSTTAPAAPARSRRRLEIAPSVQVPTLSFVRLNLDRESCEKHRVLIPAQLGATQIRAADSYRILRTRLHGRLENERLSSFGVISAGPDEGKSLTAINLALAFANEKRRNVFLLDLDLRNPSICRYLGVTPQAEVGKLLARAAKPEEVLFQTEVENLVIAGSIHSHENSSELLGGAALGELMDFIRAADPNALIICDLPPLLQSADAMVVAPNLETMLLVVGEGTARREHLSRAAETLQGLNVAGVVLNRSREAVEDYYG